MTLPPPTLSYATREPTSRLRIFAGIVLLLWSLFDLPAGVILTLSAIGACIVQENTITVFLALPFLFLGPFTLVYSIVAFIAAIRTLRNDLIALRRAQVATFIAELIWWPTFLIALPIAAGNDHAFEAGHSENLLAWSLGSLAALLIPTAITVTRILLKKALRVQTGAEGGHLG